MKNFDVVIIGAGAAGMMCAREAGLRGRSVCVIEHSGKVGEKIRISGGGRCNFTNLYSNPNRFVSKNTHFCKSALARYTPQDFIALVAAHHIAWHEKPADKGADDSARGQLFCDDKSTQIIDMLCGDARQGGVLFSLETEVKAVRKEGDGFILDTSKGPFMGGSLVIATGGLSISKIGASPFGYNIAEQFGLPIVPPRAALVPLTFDEKLLTQTSGLSGVGLCASVQSESGKAFTEGLLFTHRGLSGPSILQISTYWDESESITVNLLPGIDLFEMLRVMRQDQPKQKLHNALASLLPKRLAQMIADSSGFDQPIADLSDEKLQAVRDAVQHWRIKPQGSEGYRTAEVTRGGVDTRALSSKTMEARDVPGLYFIGEVVDVTGHLGGHNFQWAWASAVAAGQVL